MPWNQWRPLLVLKSLFDLIKRFLITFNAKNALWTFASVYKGKACPMHGFAEISRFQKSNASPRYATNCQVNRSPSCFFVYFLKVTQFACTSSITMFRLALGWLSFTNSATFECHNFDTGHCYIIAVLIKENNLHVVRVWQRKHYQRFVLEVTKFLISRTGKKAKSDCRLRQ